MAGIPFSRKRIMVKNTFKPNLIYNDYGKLRAQLEGNLSPPPKSEDYKA
jgi:hypothetical protein